MQITGLDGGFTDPPRQSARAFRAALDAMARPGEIRSVEGAAPPAPASPAAGALLLTLCDDTTPLCLAPSHDTAAMRDWITFHTAAPLVGASEAMFALGAWEALVPLSRFSPGTPEYPDRSATLIVEVPRVENHGAPLHGPGIAGQVKLNLPDPAAFAANHAAFPLGLDFYFTAGDRLAGLPRSTSVEV
ncbi:MAG: phosphonate C-P lyase system protein PhnH [Pseudomonadota bacterium]